MYTQTSSFKAIKPSIPTTSLRALMQDAQRNDLLFSEEKYWSLDLSRQPISKETWAALVAFAKERGVEAKVKQMFDGVEINETEGRAVGHVCLRALEGDGHARKEVGEVLARIKAFSELKLMGASGRPIDTVVCVGIGGSYLGTSFVYEALGGKPRARRLVFVANVDPADAWAALGGCDPETTLVVVISKTFTTAETLRNADLCRKWLLRHEHKRNGTKVPDEAVVAAHVAAVSTALERTSAFGIEPERVFPFWDWVGGRFSATSAVGVLPIALAYGWPVAREFLDGARDADLKFRDAPLQSNAGRLALAGFLNAQVLGRASLAVLPYTQLLARFPAHCQQLSMESNGKGVEMGGAAMAEGGLSGEGAPTGAVWFGEPGTNGQHSFYQLIHQGRVVPCEFIQVLKSPVAGGALTAEGIAGSHDILMANAFAQPDALALGLKESELPTDVGAELRPHRAFPGDRPSAVLACQELSPGAVGALLATYEHRVATQGWMMGINSFDQFGVELGKKLATGVEKVFKEMRSGSDSGLKALPLPTQNAIKRYLK